MIKKFSLYITIIFLALIITSVSVFAHRRIGILLETGYQGCILNVYPSYSDATNNFNPQISEKLVSISRIGIIFQGVQTMFGFNFIFGYSNFERKEWSIDTKDNGNGTYTIRDFYSIFENKKYIYGFDFEMKFFFLRIIGLKRVVPYFFIVLGLFGEINRKTGEQDILTKSDYTFGEYIAYINNFNNWYNKQRIGYTRKGPGYYGGLGLGTHIYFFDDFGLDIKLSGIFDNFGAAIMLKASIGVFYLFN